MHGNLEIAGLAGGGEGLAARPTRASSMAGRVAALASRTPRHTFDGPTLIDAGRAIYRARHVLDWLVKGEGDIAHSDLLANDLYYHAACLLDHVTDLIEEIAQIEGRTIPPLDEDSC